MDDINLLVQEIKEELNLRIVLENIPRIILCLSQINEDQLWWKPNENTNSIANLILHLDGNMRQWFLAGFCGIEYTRSRENEFNARKTLIKSEIKAILLDLATDIQLNINQINYNQLLTKRTIQNHFFVSGFSIITHVIEHFSYHTGQIALLTKLLNNEDLGFYKDLKL